MNKNIIIIIAALVASCTVKDNVDYTTISKATAHLHFHYKGFSELQQGDIENVMLYVFDSNHRLYTQFAVNREQLNAPEGVLLTYLFNDNYSVISWANVAQLSTAPVLEKGTSIDMATLLILTVDGEYISTDDILYSSMNFSIKKGEHKEYDIALIPKTYRVSVDITGFGLINNSDNYYFGLMSYGAMNFAGETMADKVTYKPKLIIDNNNHLCGEFNILRFGADTQIKLGIYNDTPGAAPIIDIPILDLVPEEVKQDIINDNKKILPIEILITNHEIYITIADWALQPMQRTDLGN